MLCKYQLLLGIVIFFLFSFPLYPSPVEDCRNLFKIAASHLSHKQTDPRELRIRRSGTDDSVVVPIPPRLKTSKPRASQARGKSQIVEPGLNKVVTYVEEELENLSRSRLERYYDMNPVSRFISKWITGHLRRKLAVFAVAHPNSGRELMSDKAVRDFLNSRLGRTVVDRNFLTTLGIPSHSALIMKITEPPTIGWERLGRELRDRFTHVLFDFENLRRWMDKQKLLKGRDSKEGRGIVDGFVDAYGIYWKRMFELDSIYDPQVLRQYLNSNAGIRVYEKGRKVPLLKTPEEVFIDLMIETTWKPLGNEVGVKWAKTKRLWRHFRDCLKKTSTSDKKWNWWKRNTVWMLITGKDIGFNAVLNFKNNVDIYHWEGVFGTKWQGFWNKDTWDIFDHDSDNWFKRGKHFSHVQTDQMMNIKAAFIGAGIFRPLTYANWGTYMFFQQTWDQGLKFWDSREFLDNALENKKKELGRELTEAETRLVSKEANVRWFGNSTYSMAWMPFNPLLRDFSFGAVCVLTEKYSSTLAGLMLVLSLDTFAKWNIGKFQGKNGIRYRNFLNRRAGIQFEDEGRSLPKDMSMEVVQEYSLDDMVEIAESRP